MLKLGLQLALQRLVQRSLKIDQAARFLSLWAGLLLKETFISLFLLKVAQRHPLNEFPISIVSM